MTSLHISTFSCVAAALLGFGLASPAAAQGAPPEIGVLVAEVLVQPNSQGPAWWRVSDEDSAVYILAVPQIAPPGLSWDKKVLERRLDGANVLLSPMDFSAIKSAPAIAAAVARAPLAMLRRPKPPPPDPVPLEARLDAE